VQLAYQLVFEVLFNFQRLYKKKKDSENVDVSAFGGKT
jgi:hypothetical protein